MSELTSKSRCPLCGEDNHCTGAMDSEPHQPCWCTTVHISQDTIAQIPQDRLGVCICPRCAGAGDLVSAASPTKLASE